MSQFQVPSELPDFSLDTLKKLVDNKVNSLREAGKSHIDTTQIKACGKE